ncbi:uncharacterized protein BHQ10_001542 [Talaromyces amestolkiae]|uniref:Cell differentiation protein rcd1 n=1 Tax=Talaromyces amestolkiae TaxID=1196081 RepID=A0A364KPP5_TALAM|nr:uncharacterized protein BHQ10_001542 [Talaromyces amestolkiae]RAO65530.1 hypothetical protein BHQ10_001542 [Talaromyces amestolkiae]
MRSFSAISLLPLLAALSQPAQSQIVTASPYDVALEQRDCSNPCGYYSQLCCTSSQKCITNSLGQAECSNSDSNSGSGSWQYYTTTYTQTDLSTVTSVYSSYVTTAPSSTTTCATSLGQSTCGTTCCSASETCDNGVCVAGVSSEESATGTATPATRPTSSGAETVTATQSATTTVGFIAPVSTNGTTVISEAHQGGGLSGGAIAGIVIGVVAGVFLLILLCACLCIRGMLDGLLALLGLRPRRRTETTYVEERISHHSHGGEAPPPRRTWFDLDWVGWDGLQSLLEQWHYVWAFGDGGTKRRRASTVMVLAVLITTTATITVAVANNQTIDRRDKPATREDLDPNDDRHAALAAFTIHQYPQAEPSWLHQQQQHHQAQHHQQQQQHSSLAAQQHAQAQAAAAAAAAAQQQHYNRIAMAGGNGSAGGNQAQGSGNNAAGLNADGSSLSAGAGIDGNISEESRKVFIWVAELLDPNRRETALMELSKKREQVPELALVIWHSFGVMTALLQEIISVYPLLNPSQLTAAASNRVCNALALLQCVASHNDTRTLFLNAHIPLFLYPFLNTTSKSRPFEYLRLTSLGVIGALVKNDSSDVINFLLTTEIIPLCLRIMETGSELSKTVAIFIVQKILLDDLGLNYICATYERFYAVGTVLSNMVTQLVEQQTVRLLKHVVRCFLRLSDNSRAREALRQCLPEPLRDATFSSVLRDDAATKRCLAQLLINLSDNVDAGSAAGAAM